MAVPNMRRTLRGWVKDTEILIITSKIVDGINTETAVSITRKVNKQPTPDEQIKRMPEQNWSFDWWSIIIMDSLLLLPTDQAIIINDARYRIEKANDWRESGFTKYQCIRDFDYEIPEDVSVLGSEIVTFEDGVLK